MTDQGQHRISQIYLKQFGFKDVNKRWRISVHEIGNPGVHEKSIKSFTKETNIFDVTLFDDEIPEIRRYFESNSSRLENFYPSVIRKIKKKNEIDNLSRSILFQFVPNLLCRTYRFRDRKSVV